MAVPQECPKCHASLADPDVPAAYAEDADQFTIAQSRKDADLGVEFWICPGCGHEWPKGLDRKQRRAAERRLAKMRKKGQL